MQNLIQWVNGVFPGVKRPEREAGKNYISCIVKEWAKINSISLYFLLASKDNIKMAVAVAVLRMDRWWQEGIQMLCYAWKARTDYR